MLGCGGAARAKVKKGTKRAIVVDTPKRRYIRRRRRTMEGELTLPRALADALKLTVSRAE